LISASPFVTSWLVALLGDLRRGADVHHEGDLALLRHLRDRQGRAGFERADDAVGAGIDHPLRLGAGHVHVGFEIDIDDLDAHAEIGQHPGRHQRAAVAALAGLGEIAGARQQQPHLQHRRLRPHDRRHRQPPSPAARSRP
jgi:hypothetical protein